METLDSTYEDIFIAHDDRPTAVMTRHFATTFGNDDDDVRRRA